MRLLLRLSINHNRLAAPPGSVKRKKEPFDARVMCGEAAASGGGLWNESRAKGWLCIKEVSDGKYSKKPC